MIPNTIVYQYGDIGSHKEKGVGVVSDWDDPAPIFETFQDEMKDSESQHKKEGYKTLVFVDIPDETIKKSLKLFSDNRLLYKYFYAGHGHSANNGVINVADGTGGVIAGRYTAYGLAEMHLLTCGSVAPQKNKLWFMGENGKPVIVEKSKAKNNILWRANVSPLGKLSGHTTEVNNFNRDKYDRDDIPGLFLPGNFPHGDFRTKGD